MKKIILLVFFVGFWILILGVTGFQMVYLYVIAIIVNSMFFVFYCCIFFKRNIFKILLITFSIGTSLFVGTLFERHLLKEKVYSFDIDGDEIFGRHETTEEQQLYFRRLINDTSTLFNYILSFPYAFFVSIFGIIGFNIIKRFIKYANTHRCFRIYKC